MTCGWSCSPHTALPDPAAQNNNDCPLPELLSGIPSIDPSILSIFSMCVPSQESGGNCTVQFEGGSVTYNGSSSGSVASYNASDTHCMNDTRSRKCVAGMWINNVILERGIVHIIVEDCPNAYTNSPIIQYLYAWTALYISHTIVARVDNMGTISSSNHLM